MQSFTATVSPSGTTVEKGIKRRVRNSPAGPITWLGYPWTARTDKGFANEGRHCAVIQLDELLLQKRPSEEPTAEVDVIITECDVASLKPLRLVAGGHDQGHVLVLLRVATHEHEAEVPTTDNIVAEGYFVEKGQCVPSRHPNTYVKQKFEERLVVLAPNRLVNVHVYTGPARVYGVKLNQGLRTSLSLMNDGEGNVEFAEKSRRPLAIANFNPTHLCSDLIGLFLFIAFFAMCGAVGANGREMMRVGGLWGGVVGLGLYQLVALARTIYWRAHSPSYTSLSPVMYKEQP